MSGAASSGALRRLVHLVLALLVGGALRLLPWPQVFTPGGVRFPADTDPLYHVLRAERILAGDPDAPWHDADLNYPLGAAVIWPPLFDELIAGAARATAGPHPPRAAVEQVAAFVPLALGLVTLPLLGELAGLTVGGGAAVLAAWLLALLPVHVGYSALGRADQHVAELLAFCWVLVAFVRCWRAGPGRAARWAAAAWLGLALATSFWIWQGSALYLLVLVIFAAAWHLAGPDTGVAAPRVPQALAEGGAIGAGLLIASLARWGAPGALTDLRLNGLTGLSVVLTLATAAFGALLTLLGRWRGASPARPGTRLGQLALAALLPSAVAAVAWPKALGGIAQGLGALLGTNPWYRQIVEFRPLLDPGPGPIWEGAAATVAELGIGPVLAALAIPGLRRRWRKRPEERAAVLLLAVLGGLFLALSLARMRFTLYLTVPMVLLTAAFAEAARTPLSRRIPLLAYGLLGLTLAGKAALHRPVLQPALREGTIEALTWLRGEAAPPGGAEAVLARWDLGHAVRYYAGKPVLVSPFGTEAGTESMADAGAFFFARSPGEAEAAAARRRIGFLVLDDLLGEAYLGHAYAPAGTPPLARARYRPLRGEQVEPTEAFWRLVPARLSFHDGAEGAAPEGGSLEGYRLLFESPSSRPDGAATEPPLKIFGIVAGADLRVSGAPPGAPLAASVEVQTNQGRRFTWRASRLADASGESRFRVPYATGRNGAVTARPLRLGLGGSAREVAVPAAAVETGGRLDVVAGPDPAAASPAPAGSRPGP